MEDSGSMEYSNEDWSDGYTITMLMEEYIVNYVDLRVILCWTKI